MTLDKKMITSIQNAMKRAGIRTHAELAEKSGINRRETITEILTGKKKDPRLSTLQKMAKACECSISELLGEDTR